MEKSILLAEDDAVTRFGMKSFLSKHFSTVFEAADGEEAWKHYLEHQPGLLITDLSMPKLDGTALIRRIRLTDSKIKILVLTAQDEGLEDIVEAEACVSKPINFKKLLIAIKDLMGD